MDIERAVQKLPPGELAKFREWFAEFNVVQWDRQIEKDVASGRLDAISDEAIRDSRDGRCKNL